MSHEQLTIPKSHRSHARIVVLGMHRSGTSCVGNLLSKMGVHFGSDTAGIGTGPENPKGFFERRDVRDICDAILHGAGCDWWAVNDFSPGRVPDRVRAEVAQRVAALLEQLEPNRPWFIKEPRLCLVWPLLRDLFEDAIYIHVWRHPIEVAQSLAERNRFPLDLGMALWEAYVRSAHSCTRGLPSVFLSYNALAEEPIAVVDRFIERLKAAGVIAITRPSNDSILEAVDANLYRQRRSQSELDDLILPAQRRLIEALTTEDRSHPALAEPLHQISRLRINDWMRREGAVQELRTGALEARRLQKSVTELTRSSKADSLRKEELNKLSLQLDQQLSAIEQVAALQKQQVAAHGVLSNSLEWLKQLRPEFQITSPWPLLLAERDEQLQLYKTMLAQRERQLRPFISKLRNSVEREISDAVDRAGRAQIDVGAAALRETMQRLCNRSFGLHAFLSGARSMPASASGEVSPSTSLLLHYLLLRWRRDAFDLATIAASGFFDPEYYLHHNVDVASARMDPIIHYVDYGWAEGRNPSDLFDTDYYLGHNPGVAEAGINPLLHYAKYGRREGRSPRPVHNRKPNIARWSLPPVQAPQIARMPRDLEGKRLVIYTAVSAGYDELQPAPIYPPNCDRVVFSDRPLQVDGWEVRPFNYLHSDPTRTARFVKLHPHVYFPEYDYSIWLDANIHHRGDICPLLSPVAMGDAPIAIFVHPLRNCIYVEADECIKLKKDDPSVIRTQMTRYRTDQFPAHVGLWETNVIARRHNDASCIDLMTAWWRELEVGSRRDQLSLPVVASRLSVEIASLSVPGVDARNHENLTIVEHCGQRHESLSLELPAAARKPVDFDACTVSIGICVHNCPDETSACLNSLLAARRPADRIVIVDDASEAPTATYLNHFASTNDNVTLIRHDHVQGYTSSANEILNGFDTDWVVLLNSDTVVPPHALRKLVINGEQFPRLGVIGPLSNAAGWQTIPQLVGPDGKFLVNLIPDGLTPNDMDRLCEEFSTGVVAFVPLVNGFCQAIRRSLIRDIGAFDAKMFPVGYGEEDDFCLRAGAAGFLCGIATDTYVYHVKSASFTPERRLGLAEAGGQALRRKHSRTRIDAAVATMRNHPELKRLRERVLARLTTN